MKRESDEESWVHNKSASERKSAIHIWRLGKKEPETQRDRERAKAGASLSERTWGDGGRGGEGGGGARMITQE